MNTKMIGIGLIVIGLLMIAVALLAPYIGLSSHTTFGTSKMLLAAVGLIVGIVGGVLLGRKKAA